jgi:PHD/YefM family antitoxin component YafN of YafNO toxin-antitoxin module
VSEQRVGLGIIIVVKKKRGSMEIRELQAQYVTDQNGKKTAVILPIEEFEELLEDLDDLAVLAERRDEPTIPHEEVIERLKRDGFLQD